MSVSVFGAVYPATISPGLLPNFSPGDAFWDPDGDGGARGIYATSIRSGADPLDLTGSGAGTLSAAAVDFWSFYERDDDIEVGRGGRGSMVVSGSLRYKSVTIGVGQGDEGEVFVRGGLINTDATIMPLHDRMLIYVGLTPSQQSQISGANDEEKINNTTILNTVPGSGQFQLAPRMDGGSQSRKPIVVGRAGSGRLRVESLSHVECHGLVVAQESGSTGLAHIDRSDSSLLSTNGADIKAGGMLWLTNGAAANATGSPAFVRSGALIKATGGGCHLTSDLTIEPDAVLRVDDDTTLIYDGTLDNQGTISLGHGAHLKTPANTPLGNMRRDKCKAPSFANGTHDESTTEQLIA